MSAGDHQQDAARLLDIQMASRPVANRAVTVARTDDGKLELSVPTEKRDWRRQLRRVLPLPEEKNVELDYLGAEFFSLCDGERTVEEIVDDYMKRWNLSFFEARGLVLQFLRALMRSGLVALATPAFGEDEGGRGDENQ